MDNNKKFGVFSSSADPQKLASTIQSLILAFASFIIIIGAKYNLVITEDQIAGIAGQAGLAASSLWFLFGIGRKIFIKLFKF